jgi:hypothetical protein
MNELFTFLSIVLVPAIGSAFLYLYKSKCQNVKLCYGCISVQRDVRGEEKTDQLQTNNTTNNIELTAQV